MPPKGKQQAPSKKAEQKKKEKVIEDKTFGLKNKKGAKQQKYIQQVEKQIKTGGIPPRKLQDENQKKLEKERKEQEKREMSLLFKPVLTQQIEKGTDPKSVLCTFFKQGQCSKGDRCKFSHDLSVERKVEKRSIYVDMRDEDDNMDTWDENKLQEVIGKKHGESNSRKPTTEIICKYFLTAVEKSKYGWFWECPNGEKCIYRHALPPGFILKKDQKKDEKKDEISIEELVERERAALGTNLTKVTLETMTAWKKRKLKEKKEALIKEEERKRNDYKAGRNIGLSGREMFYFNPDLAANDLTEEGDEAFESYAREEDEEGVEYKNIEIEALEAGATEADGTGTICPQNRFAGVTPLPNGSSEKPGTYQEENAWFLFLYLLYRTPNLGGLRFIIHRIPMTWQI
ncbi:UNVERIFIED_CONTAM: hypothetical protein PYX00_007954 [Menopon gallinae]|uniref:Zinc finger CCCH domain-containing protein 15 n=1 Tax=Menopon gallinae TaxID=328185 RepID=A0AAW2HL11_9NEOP